MTQLQSSTFTCDKCHKEKVNTSKFSTGYGINKEGEKICYDCCAMTDSLDMAQHGNAILYLVIDKDNKDMIYAHNHKVTNWPGSLSFKVGRMKIGNHNIAGKRYDVWFTGPDGATWHGVTYGDNTQICHCKRVKG